MKDKTTKIIVTALMMALTVLATMVIRVPIPFTQGYVHLGDAMVFMSVLILGRKYGAVAAGVGSALGDIIGAFMAWAPWTFVIKGCMALILGFFAEKGEKSRTAGNEGHVRKEHIIGMILAGLFMVAGYYLAEGIMYGNFAAPLVGIPWNIGQFVVGMVLAVVLESVLAKTPVGKYFTYRI